MTIISDLNGEIPISVEALKFALVVGVNNTVSSNYLPKLQYAENDAIEVHHVLRQPGCNFKSLSVLIGEKAETRDVRRAVIKLAQKKTEEDFILFYFIGHAQPMKTREGYDDIYFATYDFNEEDVKEDSNAHLSMRWLREMLYRSDGAGRVIIILDCCYAGNIVYTDADYYINLRRLIKECIDEDSSTQQNGQLRVILTATGQNTTAQEGTMTRLILSVLQGQVPRTIDENGNIHILSLYTYLQDQMPLAQLPNLSGDFPKSCILAQYPEKSLTYLQHTQQVEEEERWQKMAQLMERKVSSIITDPDYFRKLAQINQFDSEIDRRSSVEDLDQKRFIEFIKRDRVQIQDDFSSDSFLGSFSEQFQKQLYHFGLLKEKSPTYGALLCFGLQPTRWLAGAYTHCALWPGVDRNNGWLEAQDYQHNLISQFEYSCQFLRKHINLIRVISDDARYEEPELPFVALEEALANALIHREYASQTSPVYVDIFKDRVEISNPGLLPEPMTLEILEEEHKSHPRNPQIARIFYLYGYVEKIGSGILRMQYALKKSNLQPAKFKYGLDKTFTVIFYRPNNDSSIHEELTLNKSLRNDYLRNARLARGLTLQEVADELNIPDKKQVSLWEYGINTPHHRYCQALCKLFGKTMEELGFNPPDAAEEETAAPIVLVSQPEPFWNLPPVFTSMVGRDEDVDAVCKLLAHPDVRLLTLTGPGGVGKTRLSTRVAEEMRAHFADGVCFVPLDAITNPSLVVPSIAKTLAIGEHGVLSIAEQIKAALRSRQLLLLLDNFEQVATVALFLEELLAACPRLKVLVTSRVVLHLPSQHEYSIEPLDLPSLDHLPVPEVLLQYASIALFVQRAQAHKATFQLTPGNASAVAEICTRLDGLPLAIELSAACVKLLPPQTLLARLSQHLQLPAPKSRTLPERQQTLYNTIRWSYDLLDEQEQAFFRQLAVFAAGFTLEAVQVVCSSSQEIDAFNLLDALLDKSLLRRVTPDDSSPCFALLESIRAYGLDCLIERDEREIVQRRHALYYLSLLERVAPALKGADMAEWLAKLDNAQENLRSALQWLLQRQETELALRFCDIFGNFCGLRGYWTEEQRWLTATLELPFQPSHLALRAKVLRRAGHLAYRLRRLNEARALQEESVLASRQVGDNENLAGALSGLGQVLYRQSEFRAAAQAHEESVVAARAAGSKWSLANALQSLGNFMYRQGDTARVYDLLQESASLSRELLDKETLVRTLTVMVAIKLSQGDVEQAAADAQQSFALAQELGTRPLIALALTNLADVALFRGEYDRAADLYAERLTRADELGDRPTVAIMRLHLADIALAQEDFVEATSFVRESLQFFRQQGDDPNTAAALGVLAASERKQGHLAEAIALYKEALSLDKEAGNKKNIGLHLIGLAKIALDQKLDELPTLLLAAASSHLKPAVDLHPAQRASYERAMAQLHQQLPEATFQAAWSQGITLTLEQALAILEPISA